MRDPEVEVLSEELLARLSERGDTIAYPRGSRVITEGEVSDALFILLSGRLKVYTQDGKGRELIYNYMSPGEFFGELFLDGGKRSASVAAMEDSRCIRLQNGEIRRFMKTYPEFAERLALTLIQRLRQATAQLKGLALSGVHERTVRLLSQVAVEEDGQRIIPRDLTQQEIANRVGATREMVNHIIRTLVRKGFLAKGADRRLTILQDLSGAIE